MTSRPGPPEMSSTVRRFTFPVIRRRYPGEGTTPEGYTIDTGAPILSNILAHVYPKPGSTVERLEDGTECIREIEGCTLADLQLVDDSDGGRADEIEYDGGIFQVRLVAPWPGGPSGNRTWRVFEAVRVDRP